MSERMRKGMEIVGRLLAGFTLCLAWMYIVNTVAHRIQAGTLQWAVNTVALTAIFLGSWIVGYWTTRTFCPIEDLETRG